MERKREPQVHRRAVVVFERDACTEVGTECRLGPRHLVAGARGREPEADAGEVERVRRLDQVPRIVQYRDVAHVLGRLGER
jgi:hypothetical protein